MSRQGLQVGQVDRRRFAQRNECFHVCVEHRSLSPRAERVVDMRVDTSRRDIPLRDRHHF
jgi:hypothetical protein